MKNKPITDQAHALLAKPSFQRLIDLLHKKGYRVLGPALRDGAAVWETIRQVSDLPVGWRDVQEPGRYRLEETGSGDIFGVVHGTGYPSYPRSVVGRATAQDLLAGYRQTA